MFNIFKLFQEQWNNRILIFQLTYYKIKSEYANHYLGVFWNILQPAMQVAIYYVVFGLGLRGIREDIGEIPFIIHLISGIFPWLFINQAINGASSAIQSQLSLVTKMNFPSSTLLSVAILKNFINLAMTTSILLGIGLYFGYTNLSHLWALIYFVISAYALIFSISLIMSTLIIVIRDMKNVLQNVMRMFFFLTPIFWSLQNVNEVLIKINEFNPFAYLLMNYRYALVLSDAPPYGSLDVHLYFWSLVLLLTFIGAYIHYKFDKRLVDYQ